jgi:hypothetical protein
LSSFSRGDWRVHLNADGKIINLPANMGCWEPD